MGQDGSGTTSKDEMKLLGSCVVVVVTLGLCTGFMKLAGVADTGFTREHAAVVKFLRDCHRRLGLVEQTNEQLVCKGGFHGR